MKHLAFVPNSGKLVSVDAQNILKVWDLNSITVNSKKHIFRLELQRKSTLSLLYIHPEMTDTPHNHRHAFLGYKSGEIELFDLEAHELSSYQIKPAAPSRIVDIRCHPDKMHRLLITYESTAVTVHSINKNRAIY